MSITLTVIDIYYHYDIHIYYQYHYDYEIEYQYHYQYEIMN